MSKKEQKYEITFLALKEGFDKKLSEIIENLGGKIEKVDNWGLRKLAYKIAGQTSANYSNLIFTLEKDKIISLGAKIKGFAEIIRHLIISAVQESKKMSLDKKVKIVKKDTKKKEALAEPAEKIIKKTLVKKVKPEDKKTEEKTIDDDERLKKLDEKLDEILNE